MLQIKAVPLLLCVRTEHYKANMRILDLSYKMSDKDRSIWPGNSPFEMRRVSEDENNAMGCFIAHVSKNIHFRFFLNIIFLVQHQHE